MELGDCMAEDEWRCVSMAIYVREISRTIGKDYDGEVNDILEKHVFYPIAKVIRDGICRDVVRCLKGGRDVTIR